MLPADCVEAGFIARPHGVKGDVKAVFDVDDIRDYRRRSPLYLAKPNQPLLPYTVEGFSVASPKEAIIRFKGITSADEAEALKGSTIYFPVASLPPLPAHRYYYFEVEGFTIEDENLGTLGTLRTITEMSHHDVIVMDYKEHEVLIPLVDEFVLGPDKERRVMKTRLPEGLLEIYMGEGEEE